MKTTKINIRKLVADEGKIIVSKAQVEISEDISMPETYGSEIYLAASASPTDFQEMDLEEFNALLEKVDAFNRAAREAEEKALEIDSEELVVEDSDDSN